MANSKTQKKRERERMKKLSKSSFFDYKFKMTSDELVNNSSIKTEGDDSDGNRTQHRVSGGVTSPSGNFVGE